MSIRLVVADCDREYLERLSHWLHRRMPRQFDVELLTNHEVLRDWLHSGQKADVFILSAKDFQPLPDTLPNNTLVWEDGESALLASNAARITKYQPASLLIQDIMSFCADRMRVISRSSSHTYQTVLFIDLEGGSLFPAAPYTASALAQEGKRILFFSLEQNQTTDLYFQSFNPKGLNEMLYYIKSNRDNLSLRLESCLSRDSATGVDFLKAPPGLLDASQIQKADMEALLATIRERGSFDEVIISSDCIFSEGVLHLIKVADHIVFSAWGIPSLPHKLKKVWDELVKRGCDPESLTSRSRLLIIGSPDQVSPSELPAGLGVHQTAVPISCLQSGLERQSSQSVIMSLLNDLQSAG